MSEITFTIITDILTRETRYYSHYIGTDGNPVTEEMEQEDWELERELYDWLGQ